MNSSIRSALEERYVLLKKAKENPSLQADLMEMSRRDIVFWFNNFCWTWDPDSDEAEQPFQLYPFQEWFVRELVERIRNKDEWGVEKARRIGASWMIMLVYQWFWLFESGSSFLIGTRLETEVDSSNAGEDTLFGKLMFNLERLPYWMRPNFAKSHMNLRNKTKGNTIRGAAPSPSFGRGPRAKNVYLDELAFWSWPDASHGACSQTGPRGITSTPKGESNRYAKVMNNKRNIVRHWPGEAEFLKAKGMSDRISEQPNTPEDNNGFYKYVLKWEYVPSNDMAWYQKQCNKMTEDEVASELDRNYSLSVSGKVFTSFKRERHVTNKKPMVDKNRPVYRIWDFGATNCVVYGQIDASGRRVLHHERLLVKSGTPEQIPAAKADSEALFHGCEFIDICDPSGQYPDGKLGDPHTTLLEKAGIRARYTEIEKVTPAFRKRFSRTMVENDLSRLIGGEFALTIYYDPATGEGCPTIVEAFEGGYCYKKDKNNNTLDIIVEKHPFEDVMDCIFYWYLETQGTQDLDPKQFKAYGQTAYYDAYAGR